METDGLGCRELERRGGGSHRKWHNPVSGRATVLPDWGGRDLKLGTVRAAIRQLGNRLARLSERVASHRLGAFGARCRWSSRPCSNGCSCLPCSSGERGATKRYVGLADGRLHFTGMEVVCSDWTELAHEVQRELYGRLFAGDPVDDYLRQVIDEVSTGQRDRQLVYRKALRKEAGEYRALPPHVVAARKRGAPAAGELRGVIE